MHGTKELYITNKSQLPHLMVSVRVPLPLHTTHMMSRAGASSIFTGLFPESFPATRLDGDISTPVSTLPPPPPPSLDTFLGDSDVAFPLALPGLLPLGFLPLLLLVLFLRSWWMMGQWE